MESLKELYKAGPGPSSSHTLAPMRASKLFKEITSSATQYEVELYGSLSLTGKGHGTDQIIMDTLAPIATTVSFHLDWPYHHPHGMILNAYQNHQLIKQWVVYSLGGGSIKIEGEDYGFDKQVYPHQSFNEIVAYCKENNLNLAQYAYQFEPDLHEYLAMILEVMFASIHEGLKTEGVLPGSLKLNRIAKDLFIKSQTIESKEKRKQTQLLAYAYASMEQNASGKTVVTAPTMGSCGVLSSYLFHAYYDLGFSKHRLIDALAVAGLFGNLIKTNATISGAVGGCQAEVGSACSMTAVAKTYLDGLPIKIIEMAAEIAMEHHLGLTCDPIGGYVMIPCIERNGAAVLRAMEASFMATTLGAIKDNLVGFDDVVATMNYTGTKIAKELRETSLGGLATIVKLPLEE